MSIPFNKAHFFGNEENYIKDVINSGNLAGNGIYTQKVHNFFKKYYRINHCLLTNSCTAALEMAALLINIRPGDEVIIPAYGYMSTANAFVLRGAKIVFIDSMINSPNLNVELLEDLITEKTKAIVVLHYGSVSVDMDKVMDIANDNGIFVIEDAAHGIDAYYKNQPLGTIGHLGTLSFHATKNITSGHGGLLFVNDTSLIERSNLIWQKGTDKIKYDLGQQDYYKWVDIGSSFFPSEIIAAFLYGQLIHLENITKKRVKLWNYYMAGLKDHKDFQLPIIPLHSSHNGHIFYIYLKDTIDRYHLIKKLKQKNINAYSHYLSLPESPFMKKKENFSQARQWQDRLLRLPLFYSLSCSEIDYIIQILVEDT